MEKIVKKIEASLDTFEPEIGIILGSGWGDFLEAEMSVVGRLPYNRIKGFPVSTVAGHAGEFVWGTVGDARVIAMKGRFHFYEGYRMEQATLPVRILKLIGVNGIFLTNAAGGISKSFKPGDLMLIEDHINLMGTNPLIGENLIGFGPRFPDLTEAYDKKMRLVLGRVAKKLDIPIRKGVYLAVTGPSFETPAEIHAFRTLGADAVGMSTVPECIVARHCGMRVVAMSCITNVAAGMQKEPLSHEDVTQTAGKVGETVGRYLREALPALVKELKKGTGI